MPGRLASVSRIRNSVTVSVTPWPSQLTLWRAGSIVSRPRVIGSATGSSSSQSRSEEHTSELQSLMRISYAVFCLKKKNQLPPYQHTQTNKHTLYYNSINA